MATTLEIIRAIAQASSNTYDGALDENGEPVKIGLRREEDVPFTEPRLIDGFKVSMSGDMLLVKYHSEIKLKETHDKNFETNIDSVIADAVSFLKKEYKKVMSEDLTLTKQGETDMIVQSTSRVRVWVQACAKYLIGNLKDVDPVCNANSENRTVDEAIRDFLAMGKK